MGAEEQERAFEVTYPLTFIVYYTGLEEDEDPDLAELSEHFVDSTVEWLMDGGNPSIDKLEVKEVNP